MLREKTVFGPIISRRLGVSLGINIMPENGKICTFDCIYCECGWNKDGRDDTILPTVDKVRNDLEKKLIELNEQGVKVDSITFSGDGESTLHPQFAEIVDVVISLRNSLAPKAIVSILSNATQVHRPEVFEALRKFDNPIMKIDAPTNELIAKINKPAKGYDINRVVEALRQFEGNFILQTMFLKCPDNGFDSSSNEVLSGWIDIVRDLKPREIMVYTIDRPTPAEGLVKFTVDEMKTLVKPLIDEGFKIQIKG